jgi:hypothetical protein
MRDFPPEFESSSRSFGEHTVQVTIGRLEIRAAVTPAPAAARRPDVASKTASLEEYLRGRAKAGRK